MRTLLQRFCITMSRLVPRNIYKKFSQQVKYSGKTHDPQIIIGGAGLLTLIIILLSILVASMYPFHTETKQIEDDLGIVTEEVVGIHAIYKRLMTVGAGFIFSLSPFFIVNIYYFFLVEKRSKTVDKMLPDALSLISSNLVSGLTPYHAVKSAIKKEFGPIAEAFELATNKSIGSKSFKESLYETVDTVNSDSYKRAIRLFVSAMESGTNSSVLLKNLAQDIQERRALKKELITNTTTNSMFIMFMTVVGGPLLMSVAIFFVKVVSSIQGTAGISGDSAQMAGLGMGGEIVITTGFLTIYAYIFFFITGFIVSYFTGVMIEGKGKSGLKKAPLIIIASYIMFMISRVIIENALGGMF
ncbi:MAG: type II secretion system F family protein [Nanobdellota archaeon]